MGSWLLKHVILRNDGKVGLAYISGFGKSHSLIFYHLLKEVAHITGIAKVFLLIGNLLS